MDYELDIDLTQDNIEVLAAAVRSHVATLECQLEAPDLGGASLSSEKRMKLYGQYCFMQETLGKFDHIIQQMKENA